MTDIKASSPVYPSQKPLANRYFALFQLSESRYTVKENEISSYFKQITCHSEHYSNRHHKHHNNCHSERSRGISSKNRQSKPIAMHPEISVIIPCYKEAEVIRDNVLAVSEFLKARFTRFEIIVVTDGSPDGTAAIATKLKEERSDIPLKVFSFTQNRGKGAAVRAGVLKSSFDPVMFIDADLTIPIEELDTFFPALSNADIVIASRLLSGSQFEEPSPWYRVLMARVFHLLQILILGNFEFSDTQCGFKIFRRAAAFDLFGRSSIDRFAFDAEILFLATLRNYKVAVRPVAIKRDPRNTNVRIFRDSINMIFALLKIRWNQLTGHYRALSKPFQNAGLLSKISSFLPFVEM